MKNKGFLQLIDIKKTYNDGYVACENINISINRGEFVTILGPSGCGKTTILKLIAGFESPTKGKIVVNDIDIKNLPIHHRPTATVFQDYALFPNLTAYENVMYGLKIMRTKLDNLPKNIKKECQKVNQDALKKAKSEIKKIEKSKKGIDRSLKKLNIKYQRNSKINTIQNMRYSQYESQIHRWTKQMKKKYGEDCEFHLSFKNKMVLWSNNFFRFIGYDNKIVKFDTTGMNEYQTKIARLISLFSYKTPFDKKIDNLIDAYQELDQMISYWENYPILAQEHFEKKFMTRPLTKQEMDKKAREAIALVGLEGKENKYASEMSGGMQQRVALARAIVIEPEILLLDEPLSALDAKVRVQMQKELKRLHNELGITFVLVTHDQEEALSLSNKIIVMSRGKIEQIDTPKNIYEKPANQWIGKFIGDANFFDVTIKGDEQLALFDKVLNVPKQLIYKHRKKQSLKLMIRTEDVSVCSLDDCFFKVKIDKMTYHGTMFDIECSYKGQLIKLKTTQQFKNNEVISINWDWSDCIILQDKEVKNVL